MYKIGNVGHQQRELRFPLDILHRHYLPPAVEERRTKALAPIGSLRSEWQEEVMVLLGVCTFFLPYMPGNHPFLELESWFLALLTTHVALAPLLPRKHYWSLALGLDSLLAKDRLHHSASLEATWACRSARICQKH